jgi:hypothetical protein
MDIPGASMLGQVGRDIYDGYYRTRYDWARGDLVLICQAAAAHEQVLQLQFQAIGQPAILENPTTGGAKPNPFFGMIATMNLQIRNCLRDANLRAKDGAEVVEAPIATPATTRSSVITFEEYLRGE